MKYGEVGVGLTGKRPKQVEKHADTAVNGLAQLNERDYTCDEGGPAGEPLIGVQEMALGPCL